MIRSNKRIVRVAIRLFDPRPQARIRLFEMAARPASIRPSARATMVQ
jgi:hypothetical protein